MQRLLVWTASCFSDVAMEMMVEDGAWKLAVVELFVLPTWCWCMKELRCGEDGGGIAADSNQARRCGKKNTEMWLLWREWRALMVVAAWRCRSVVLQGVEAAGSRRTLRFSGEATVQMREHASASRGHYCCATWFPPRFCGGSARRTKAGRHRGWLWWGHWYRMATVARNLEVQVWCWWLAVVGKLVADKGGGCHGWWRIILFLFKIIEYGVSWLRKLSEIPTGH